MLVPLTDTLAVSAGPVPVTCQGVGVTLPVTSNGAGFSWTPAGGLSSTTVADPVAQPSATTTFTVTATLGVCTKTANVPVTVLPAPVAVAGVSDTICPGQSAQLQGSGGVQYQWSPATYLSDSTSAGPMVEQPASTVTYHLTVTGANGCSSVDSAATTVVVSLPPKVFAGDDTSVVIGQTLQLNAVDVDGSGFTSYAWSPAPGVEQSGYRGSDHCRYDGHDLYCSGDFTFRMLGEGNNCHRGEYKGGIIQMLLRRIMAAVMVF